MLIMPTVRSRRRFSQPRRRLFVTTYFEKRQGRLHATSIEDSNGLSVDSFLEGPCHPFNRLQKATGRAESANRTARALPVAKTKRSGTKGRKRGSRPPT